MRVKKAVIPAAGWGTRFLPVTKSQPKEMLPLGNKPVIQHSIEEAVACGVDLVVVVTSAGKSSIENYFDRSLELESVLLQKGDAEMVASLRGLSELADIVFVRQREQLGLGHAVLTASKVIGEEPFLLILPDDLFEQPASVLPQMVEVYQEFGGSVLSIKQVSDEEVSRYGIIASRQIAPRTHQVYDMVEKPSVADAPSHLAIMGRYLLTPEIPADRRTEDAARQPVSVRLRVRRRPVRCRHAARLAGSLHYHRDEGPRPRSGTAAVPLPQHRGDAGGGPTAGNRADVGEERLSRSAVIRKPCKR